MAGLAVSSDTPLRLGCRSRIDRVPTLNWEVRRRTVAEVEDSARPAPRHPCDRARSHQFGDKSALARACVAAEHDRAARGRAEPDEGRTTCEAHRLARPRARHAGPKARLPS